MNLSTALLSIILIFPLCLAFLQNCFRTNSIIWRTVNALGPIIFFLLNCWLLIYIVQHDFVHYTADFWHFSSGIKLNFEANLLLTSFMVFVSFLWIMNSLYTIPYLDIKYSEKDSKRFFFYISLSIFAATLVTFADNLPLIFAGYEFLTFTTLPLVVYSGLREAKKSTHIYVDTLVCISLACLLPALIVLETHDYGNTLWQILLPFLIVYGLAKCALFPLHFWLPKAMVAPTPVSAMFHAVAVVKIGIICLLKFVFLNSDLTLNLHNSAYLLHYIAGFSAIYAGARAIQKDNLKAILAYSTITHLSYLIMTVGLFDREALPAIMFHIFAHGLAKLTLFMATGAISAKNRIYNVSEIHGIAHQMPLTMGCFIISALSIIGIPPFFGGISKFLLIMHNRGSFFGIGVLIVGTMLNVYYMSRIIFYSMERNAQIEGISEAPRGMLLPMLICTILTITFGVIGFWLFLYH